MNINTITTLIGSLGFPIAVCVACFWFINKTLKDITSALTTNTSAMTRLIDKITDLIKSFKEEK